MRHVLSALLLACAFPAAAAQFRLQPRAQYETGELDLGDGRNEVACRGARPALDLFYEQPFHYGAGLTVHRGRYKRVGLNEYVLGTTLGFEGKLFPSETLSPWFVRTGVLAEALDPNGPSKDMWVYGGSIGTGLELPLWDRKLGLAPEVGVRSLWGSRGRTLRNFYAALGVNLYAY